MPITLFSAPTLPRIRDVTRFETVPMPLIIARREPSALDVVRRRVATHPGMQELLATWRPIARHMMCEDDLVRAAIGQEATSCGMPLILSGGSDPRQEDAPTVPVAIVEGTS